MKYQHLLFSRSLYEDYRWILVPNLFSPEDKKKIEELLWQSEIREHLIAGLRSPFSFCLILLSKSYVLARFGRTEYVDASRLDNDRKPIGRPIDCIDGIAVPLSEAWALRLSLSWILTDYLDTLKSWGKLDFPKSDSLTDVESKEYDFELNKLIFHPSSKDISNSNWGGKQFPFSQDGYNRLVGYIYPSSKVKRLDLLQIAYGVTPSVARQCKGFDIISEWNQPLTKSSPSPEPTPEPTPIVNTVKPHPETPPMPSPSTFPSPTEFNRMVDDLKSKNSPPKESPPVSRSRKKTSLLEQILQFFD
jgi:hypothetical protein